jgi:ECF sigma factor
LGIRPGLSVDHEISYGTDMFTPRYMAEECSRHTLQATALVNQAYPRLVSDSQSISANAREGFVQLTARGPQKAGIPTRENQPSETRGSSNASGAIDYAFLG